MKKAVASDVSPARKSEFHLDRLEMYSLTARGLLLALVLFLAYSLVSALAG
jgi:hypothetical protein